MWRRTQADESTQGAVRFAAALVLRNLARASRNRDRFRPYERALFRRATEGAPESPVLASTLGQLAKD